MRRTPKRKAGNKARSPSPVGKAKLDFQKHENLQLLTEHRGDARKTARTWEYTKDSAGYTSFKIRPTRNAARAWAGFTRALLPEGYPRTVTEDYLQFQIWDSIQAICSYVRSSFTTKALLEGIGVGNNAATALGATTQFFARDLTGRVGSIAFALAQGNRLDASAKQWRLFADCCNNVAYLLELAAPVFPAFFVPLLCLASLGHALTGIAGGATRAALTQHFARASNAADVAAKEGSQETLTTLVGMFLGMWALHVVGDNAEAMWALFLALTVLHVFSNVCAVRALRLSSINRERAEALVRHYVRTGEVLSRAEVAAQEALLPPPFSLRSWRRERVRITMGEPLPKLLRSPGDLRLPDVASISGAGGAQPPPYTLLLQRGAAHVLLHPEAGGAEALRGFVHALLVADMACINHDAHDEDEGDGGEAGGSGRGGAPDAADAQAWRAASIFMRMKYERFLADLREAGWTPEHVVVAPGPWRVAAGPGAAAEGAGVARPLWATLGPRVGAAAANGGGSVGADPAWAAAGEELVTGDAAAVEDGEEELLYGSAGAAGVVAAA